MKSILLSLQGHKSGSTVSKELSLPETKCCVQAQQYHTTRGHCLALFPLLKEAESKALGLKLRLGGCGQVDLALKVCHLAGWEWQQGLFTSLERITDFPLFP